MNWYNSSWLYRIKITIPSSRVPSTLTNFPVYVDLGLLTPAFHKNVRSDAGDIRVCLSDGDTEVAREITSYSSTTNAGEMHFKAPTLSSTVDNVFYIYYGNPSATNHSNAGTYGAFNVWTANYAGVFHLDNANDASSNGNTGATSGSPSFVEGKIGRAVSLQANQWVEHGGSINTLDNTMAGRTALTLSCWAQVNVSNSIALLRTMLAVNTSTGGNTLIMGINENQNSAGFYDISAWEITGTANVVNGGWHQVTYVRNGSSGQLYINGVLQGSHTANFSLVANDKWSIGQEYDNATPSDFFNGLIDEVRVSTTNRSADWVLTEYRNQSAQTSFIDFGVQEWLDYGSPQVPIVKILKPGELDIPEYTVELWSSTGVYVADVSTILTTGLRMTFPLNDVEEVEFTLDLVQFEEKCARIGAEPRNILDPYRTEVKIKRNGAYILGTQVVRAQINLNNQGANTIEVRATGYLNLFKDRYITPGIFPSGNANNYQDMTYAELAQRLIYDTQKLPNGDQGVMLGEDKASPFQSKTRTRKGDYDNQNVKDGILNLIKLQNDNFDFRFTWDKRFECFNRLGRDRPDIELVYPQNIVSMSITRDASTLANRITGIGSGIGDERVIATATDSASTLNYNVRERIELFNSTQNLSTLTSSVVGLLPIYSDIYEAPVVNVTNGALQVGDVITGDSVYVRVENSTFTTSIDSLYRIIEMSVNVGINSDENISLKLVKWG